jgi:hypothetical protein
VREGRSWPAAPLKKLRVTKITEVASMSGAEKDYLRGLLTSTLSNCSR